MIKKLRTLHLPLLAALALLLCPVLAQAASSNLTVTVDHGTSLTLSAPAASVFIANPEIADVQVMSPTSVMVFGKRTGSTTFMATDRGGHVLAHHTVLVTQDLSDLRVELDAAIPGNKIHVQPLPNGIVLTGEAKDPSSVSDAYRLAQRYLAGGGDIINRIKVLGSNQIQIRVRFAEVSRTVNTTFGIDWSSAATFGGVGLAFGAGAAIARGTDGGIIRPNNPSLTTPNDVFAITHTGQHTNLNNLIDALAQDGLVTILAEPNLTAMSGETANFLAGGEFPIPVPQSSSSTGGTIITVDFKNYGISLAFTPTLIGENRINLHVKPEVSQLTDTGAIVLDNITVPALTTRKAETTVEVASGESFAIAGLMDNNQAQTINKYPLIGDLPIIGALFRSNQFKNNQSELVIIITPYIVRPTDDHNLALPTDGYSPPSDFDRLAKLRYSASDPNAKPISGGKAAVIDQPVEKVLQPVIETTPLTGTVMDAPAPAPYMPVAPSPIAVTPMTPRTTPDDMDGADEDMPSDSPPPHLQPISTRTELPAASSPSPSLAPAPVSKPVPMHALPPRPAKVNTNGFIME